MRFGRWEAWGGDGTWYRWLLAVGAAALILWVALGVLRGDGDDWARRGSPAIAWTGERLFVYGGNPVPSESESAADLEPLNDAALIDAGSGDIERIADPPFNRPLRVSPAVVAIDGEVVLVGQLCGEPDSDAPRSCAAGAYRAAVYSPEDDAWRELRLPGRLERISNGQTEAVGSTSDGRAVFVLGPRGGFGAVASRELWTYSVADDDWEALPSPGALIEGFCLAGDVVVVGSGLLPATAGVPTDDLAEPAEPAVTTGGPTLRLMALDNDTRIWLPTPAAGVVPTGETASITCGDDRVLFDDGADAMRVYGVGSGEGWREPAPRPGDDVHALRLWTGAEFVFLDPNSPTLAYDPEADSWRGIEGSAGTGVRSVWTGEVIIGWPGRTDLPVQFDIEP